MRHLTCILLLLCPFTAGDIEQHLANTAGCASHTLMCCALAGKRLFSTGILVHSRLKSVDVMLQGTTPKKTPGLAMRTDIGSCGDRLSRPACWTFWPRKGGSTDRSNAQLIRVWFRDVFRFPCQAREHGLPVAASPVPASSPHGFRGMTGRTTNHSTFGPSTRCCRFES